MIHDQKFYALRHVPGKDLTIPFPVGPFNCMIHADGNVADETINAVGMQLLQHGMRSGICSGDQPDRISDTLDKLIDDNQFHHNNQTVYSHVVEEETIQENMEYFVLPNGLADIGLILVIGSEAEYHDVIGAFGIITENEFELVESACP